MTQNLQSVQCLSMPHTLLLRPNERSIFRSLPAPLRDGWKVEEENLHVEDNDEAFRETRLHAFPFPNSAVRAFAREAQKCEDIVDMAKLMQKNQSVLDGLDNQQYGMLFAAIGPKGMDIAIEMMLRDVRSPQDLEGIHHFSELRHHVIEHMGGTVQASEPEGESCTMEDIDFEEAEQRIKAQRKKDKAVHKQKKPKEMVIYFCNRCRQDSGRTDIDDPFCFMCGHGDDLKEIERMPLTKEALEARMKKCTGRMMENMEKAYEAGLKGGMEAEEEKMLLRAMAGGKKLMGKIGKFVAGT